MSIRSFFTFLILLENIEKRQADFIRIFVGFFFPDRLKALVLVTFQHPKLDKERNYFYELASRINIREYFLSAN